MFIRKSYIIQKVRTRFEDEDEELEVLGRFIDKVEDRTQVLT